MTGKPVDPLEASKGKVVVLLFIRTDCPVSNRYAPTIRQLSAAFAAQAKFWLVYPDKDESPEAIRAHDRDYRYTLSALRDPQHILVKLGGATITPEAAVFAADGHLVYHGRIDNWFVDFGRKRAAPTIHDLRDAITAAIAGKPATLPTEHAVGCYIADLN
ncbi:MAG TPA: redoxin domain-containing protein [Candidatus Acidoferrum sp.]|nr:redoxin domain-containing protein [Candidatus Acidoferrum sp.]